jgi:hypothetical protein
MVCKYGQCVYQQPYIPPVVPVYTAHYRTACYSNNLYWYDSLNKVNTLYKNCVDTNSCTFDSCVSGQCDNTIKCDGSTCATGTADYNTYCQNNNADNDLDAILTSFFASQNQGEFQWQKSVSVGSNGQVYFMITIANNSVVQVDGINVFANIPNEIVFLGNLQINGAQVAGDIVSGISIGALAPGTAKTITFEGKTQTILTSSTKTAVATVALLGASKTDSISVNLNPAQVAGASVSSTESTSGFWTFLKRWYLWILVGLALIFLFIIVFRRLSSNT